MLEAQVLASMRQQAHPAPIQLIMGNFVVVSHGRRGIDTPAMHEAAELARKAVRELDCDPFSLHLATQKFYRATSFIPFLAGDVAKTLRLLEQAEAHQLAAKSEAKTELELLAWIDHAFPLYETIAKTHARSGNVDEAVTATEHLVELSPNDQRTWAARGQALLRAGRFEEALNAYQAAVPLGGLPVARATYHLGWLHGQLGNQAEENECYRTSQMIDPTVPAVNNMLEHANPGKLSA
ncbi:tetratricopeptide repeat protein [Amycolatopsis keratiniphila]|uniref:tetratricopeptide repeat protein n=1 Tax=Amycolatopsis keratiniphila TaxID=129921 RepID=UPI0033CAFD5C